MRYLLLILFLLAGCGGGYVSSGDSQGTWRPQEFYNPNTGEYEWLVPGSRNKDSYRNFYSDPQTGEFYYPIGKGKFYQDSEGNLIIPED